MYLYNHWVDKFILQIYWRYIVYCVRNEIPSIRVHTIFILFYSLEFYSIKCLHICSSVIVKLQYTLVSIEKKDLKKLFPYRDNDTSFIIQWLISPYCFEWEKITRQESHNNWYRASFKDEVRINKKILLPWCWSIHDGDWDWTTTSPRQH